MIPLIKKLNLGFFLTIIFCTKKTIFIVFLGAFVDPLATAVVEGILVLILQFICFYLYVTMTLPHFKL